MPRIVTNQEIVPFNQETASIGAHLIVVEGTADGQVKLPGGADAGGIVGITQLAGNATADTRILVVTGGYAELFVKAAGTSIARGDYLSIHGTSGMGKKAAPAAGVNTFIAAKAMEAATADDVLIAVKITLFIMQGA